MVERAARVLHHLGPRRAVHRRRAGAGGPPSPVGPQLSQLLARAGFVDVGEVDVTAAHLETTRAWLAARRRHRNTVPLDPAMFDERVSRNAVAVAAIDAGLLRCTVYVADVPYRPGVG